MSEWISPLLLAVIRHGGIATARLPGLRKNLLRVDCADERGRLFELLLTATPCSPAEVLPFVSLEGDTLDSAWVRWLKRSEDRSRAIADLLQTSASWDNRHDRLKAIFETVGEPPRESYRALHRDEEVAESPTRASIPKLTWLVREPNQRTVASGRPLSKIAPPALEPLLPRLEESFSSENIDPILIREVLDILATDRYLARWANGWLPSVLRGYQFGSKEWPKHPSRHPVTAPKLAWVQYLALLGASCLDCSCRRYWTSWVKISGCSSSVTCGKSHPSQVHLLYGGLSDAKLLTHLKPEWIQTRLPCC